MPSLKLIPLAFLSSRLHDASHSSGPILGLVSRACVCKRERWGFPALVIGGLIPCTIVHGCVGVYMLFVQVQLIAFLQIQYVCAWASPTLQDLSGCSLLPGLGKGRGRPSPQQGPPHFLCAGCPSLPWPPGSWALNDLLFFPFSVSCFPLTSSLTCKHPLAFKNTHPSFLCFSACAST